MDFAWTGATLLAFFVGLAVGGGLGYKITKDDEEKKKGKGRNFCQHCGKPLTD